MINNLSKLVIRRGELHFAPEVERDIARTVLRETNFGYGTHVVDALREHDLNPRAFCGISPEIKVSRDGVSGSYQTVTIDLRDYPKGVDETCDDATHTPIVLRWEEGGGGMDSGTPYRYLMCSRCGKNLGRRHVAVWAAVAMVTLVVAVAIAVITV